MMKKTPHTPTIYCYINDMAAFYSPGKVMQDFISKALNVTTWRHTSDLYSFPKIMRELLDGDTIDISSFTAGYCTGQYSMARNGLFINPCLTGLMDEPQIWTSLLRDSEHINKIIYLDVPYSTYLDACDETPGLPVEDEEAYEELSILMESLVVALVTGTTNASKTHH